MIAIFLIVFSCALSIFFIIPKSQSFFDFLFFATDSSKQLRFYRKFISKTYKEHNIIEGNKNQEDYFIIDKEIYVYYEDLPLKDRIVIKVKVFKVLLKREIEDSRKKEIKNAFKNKKKM